MSEFRVPFAPAESEFVEKRSRFISHIWPVESEEQAQQYIKEMKTRYYDARHNCWCYRIGPAIARYSDDGEPQGTAGQPMLKVLEREEVTNVCCVVTRYFGGILLGAGGLTRAYSKSARDALAAAGNWVEKEVVGPSQRPSFRINCSEILPAAGIFRPLMRMASSTVPR